MSYDLFVSYHHLDGDRVKPLIQALRDLGLSVWFDEDAIDDFAPITEEISEGLAGSKAFLAWYSKDYPQSRPCQMELTAAYIAADQARGSATRILVINPEDKVDHIQPLSLRDKRFLSGDLDSTELAHRIATHLAKVTDCLGAILPVTATPQHGAQISGSSRFVGRLPELWDLHSRLHEGENAIISGRAGNPDQAQVSGMGGQGKSLLTEEYALRFGAAYPGGIFWLRGRGQDSNDTKRTAAEQEMIRESAFRDIAQRLEISGQGLPLPELEGQIRRKLRGKGLPFLWVVDDLASELTMEMVRAWHAPDTFGKTIITTRSRKYGTEQDRLDLDVLEPDEALQLFLSHRTEGQAPVNDEEEQLAREIAISRLGRHALAVDVAGGAAQQMGYSEFLAKLDTKDNDVLELAAQLGSQLPNGHKKNIAATFLQSIDLLDEPGRDYLRLAACLATAPIPRRLVSWVFAKADDQPEEQANTRALLAADQAAKLSLAENHPGEQSQTVHLLITRTVRFHDQAPERVKCLRRAAIEVLSGTLDVVSVSDIRNHADLAREVEHGRHLYKDTADDRSWSVLLALSIGHYDYIRGSYSTARALNEKTVEFCTRVLGEEHPGTLKSMSELANTLSAQGDLAGARTFEEKALEVNTRVRGEEHPDTLSAMNNLAATLRAQGDHAGARTFEEKALEVSIRVLGEEHPQTLTTMNNLGLTLKAQGDLAGARTLLKISLEASIRVLGEDHPDTLKSMNNLAITLSAQGDLTGARTLEEKALEVSIRVRGEEHPDTLAAMNNLAGTLKALGDLTGARMLQEKALEVSIRVRDEDHPDTLTAMNNLAATLRAQGDLAEARTFEEKALEVRIRVLGEEHPDTITAMNNLGLTLKTQGDLTGARTLEEKALEISIRVRGEEHPDTLQSMDNLAVTLQEQGDLAGARTLLEKTLEVSNRILGKEHPDSTSSAWNLFNILLKQEDPTVGEVLTHHLIWLYDCDPADLGADQSRIRDYILSLLSSLKMTRPAP